MTARLLRLADRLVEIAAGLVLLAMLGVIVLGVATRALGDPLVWTDELARILMVWTALLGWSIAARRRGHIRIGLVIERLPEGARRALETVLQLAVLAFGAGIAWHGVALVERNLDIEAVSMPLPAAILYVPLVLCGAAVALQAGAQVVEAIRGPVAIGEARRL